MSASLPPEPDRSGTIIHVGQDRAGHWLVQDEGGRIEGRFVSFAAAMRYAQDERDLYRATVRVSANPLSPFIPYGEAGARDDALLRAA